MQNFNSKFLSGNCRQASCGAGQWTSWLPQPGDGQCVKQTRHLDKIPTYTYKQQLNDCGGIVGSCPARVVENRVYCKYSEHFSLTEDNSVETIK